MKKIVYLAIMLLTMGLFLTACGKGEEYKKAVSMYEAGQYEEAALKFNQLGDYEDSKKLEKTCKYELGKKKYNDKKYEEAKEIFLELDTYEDSKKYAQDCESIIARKMMYEKYGSVIDALKENTWCFNGGSDTTLNGLQFNDEGAIIIQTYFDGDGQHLNGKTACPYVLDDKNITITLEDGTTKIIPYTLNGKKISLNDKEYVNLNDVDSHIQGCWKESSSDNFWGPTCFSEKNILFDNGKVIEESASNNMREKDGSYFYYGPNEGTYKVNFGHFNFEGKITSKNLWGYNIIDNEVKIIHGGNVCQRTDALPGIDGYKNLTTAFLNKNKK